MEVRCSRVPMDGRMSMRAQRDFGRSWREVWAGSQGPRKREGIAACGCDHPRRPQAAAQPSSRSARATWQSSLPTRSSSGQRLTSCGCLICAPKGGGESSCWVQHEFPGDASGHGSFHPLRSLDVSRMSTAVPAGTTPRADAHPIQGHNSSPASTGYSPQVQPTRCPHLGQ